MEVFSTKDTAAYLKVNEKKIYQLVKDGDIPHTRIGGKIIFSREILDRWIREKTVQEQNILVTGSDDALLKRVIDQFNKSSPHVAFYAPLGSIPGLQLLEKGRAGVCAVHILDLNGRHSLTYLDRYLDRNEFYVVRLFTREQGIYLSPGNPHKIKSFADLFKKKLRFLNRNPGSGTRILIDFQTAKLREGMEKQSIQTRDAYSHLDAGIQVLTGKVDASFGIRYVAEMLKLDFIPVMQEPFDFVIPAHSWENRNIVEFLRFFDQSVLFSQMNDLQGYDLSAMGSVVWRPPTSGSSDDSLTR
ncbi:MAG: helix-turn-helix transcriptional regulator [Candidatus Ozemobacteraceae bacterium]